MTETVFSLNFLFNCQGNWLSRILIINSKNRKLSIKMMNLGSVPWESSARFLYPSGPSNNTESWICRISSLRKFSLAASLSGGLLGNVFRWSLLNLLIDETWTSLSMLGQLWFYRLSDWMNMSLQWWSPDSQSVCGVKVGPPHQLQSCNQSLILSHLHLDTDRAELRDQRLQELFRWPRSYR